MIIVPLLMNLWKKITQYHERNIQTLAIELYKVVNGLSPKSLEEVFPMKKATRYCSKFPIETFNVHTTNYGTHSVSYEAKNMVHST